MSEALSEAVSEAVSEAFSSVSEAVRQDDGRMMVCEFFFVRQDDGM